ncbi:MAG: hypothetical protein JSR18_10660 [Proteobacteria bacterium]|nr:hypothetical protein [Pseudomonadota bacterium]
MNCNICGFANAAESRFCKKCGAALIVPGGADVPAAATATVAAAPAATGASVPLGDVGATRKLPLLPFVMLAVVLAIAIFVAFRMMYYGKSETSIVADTAVATPPGATATTAPADAATTPPADAGSSASTSAPAPEPAPPAPGASASTPEPTAAAHDGEAPAPAHSAPKKPAPAKPRTAPPPPAPAPAPKQNVVAAVTAPASAQVAAAPQKDRWAQMLDAVNVQCAKETFLNKVICEQKVRAQYCDGYWGKVTQCPMGMRDADKGQ